MSIMIVPIIMFIVIVLGGVFAVRGERSLLRFNEDQVKQCCSEYGYGCYDVFEREFNKIEWERNHIYPRSLYQIGYFHSSAPLSRIHASIIEFNGKGMILKGSDKRKAERLIKKKLKEIPLPNDGKGTMDWGCKK